MGRRDFKTTLIHEPGRLAILMVLSPRKTPTSSSFSAARD
jgi:hypothetical protein